MIKRIYKKSTPNIFNGERIDLFLLRVHKDFYFLFNTVLGFYSGQIRQENWINHIHIGKEEVILSLFVDGMTLYIITQKEIIETVRNKKVQQDCRTYNQYANIYIFIK